MEGGGRPSREAKGNVWAALDCEKACGAVLGVAEEPGAGCDRRGGGGKGDIIRVGGSPGIGNVDARVLDGGTPRPAAAAPGGGGVKAREATALCAAGATAAAPCAAVASSCAVSAGFATHVSKSESSVP
jgi:hypothetical protein